MGSKKTVILLSAIILAQAFFYFPRVCSFIGNNIFNLGKKILCAIQKVAPLLADVLWDKPKEWKRAIDTRFKFLSRIPQHAWYLQQVSAKGNATKAENVIKSLRFSSYQESNLCDLKEGIPGVEFDVTVEEIAELTNMPTELKRVVKRAKNFSGGNVFAFDRLHFKTKDGNMVFGRIAVLRKGSTLDLAYSLHSVNYALKKRQKEPEGAANFTKFSEILNKTDDVDDKGDKDDDDDSNDISLDLRNDFLAFFHKQAIEGFVKHCDYLLKTLDNGQKEEPEILKHMAVNDGEKLEDVKGDGVN
ncbi:uncharacterized protein [Acropora muricata]|uniref:uncharacterized protein isoform X1 n=1 Tax=Acropora muricata TaxID=159855 RepID=UPI0034E4A0E2